jgi:transcriptional regulator with XRE-family HTH domain
MKNKIDIEQQLKNALKKSDMTMYQIAKISGLSNAQLSYFINGKRSISLPTAAKLVKILELELAPIVKKFG